MMTEVDGRDDRIDAIVAIEDATAPTERRGASRIRRKVASQMVPWSVGTPAVAFGVVIEDISANGIGIIHSESIEPGEKFLVTVPRAYLGAVVIECTAVRCEQRGRHLHKIGLQAIQPIEHVEHTRESMTVTSRRTKLLFLAFGIIGLAAAALVPM